MQPLHRGCIDEGPVMRKELSCDTSLPLGWAIVTGLEQTLFIDMRFTNLEFLSRYVAIRVCRRQLASVPRPRTTRQRLQKWRSIPTIGFGMPMVFAIKWSPRLPQLQQLQCLAHVPSEASA